ncbi:MAG: hypothetical protein ACRDYA_08110 [Egibacteraceae bacterium]
MDEAQRPRSLVPSQGPGVSPMDPRVRVLRVAVPAVFFAGLVAVVAVFFSGLDPGTSRLWLGDVDAVRAAVADRPRRACFNRNNPCAWIALVNGRLHAFNTNGPLPQEFGRQGVGWCPSSGGYGANATGSRWDAAGNVVEGPARRGLDRFALIVRRNEVLEIDFASLSAGLPDWQVRERIPPTGPDCEPIPFDREPELEIPG